VYITKNIEVDVDIDSYSSSVLVHSIIYRIVTTTTKQDLPSFWNTKKENKKKYNQ